MELLQLLFGTLIPIIRVSRSSSNVFILLGVVAVAVGVLATSTVVQSPFPNDHLIPYPQGRHGRTRTYRDISSCVSTSWENRTTEEILLSKAVPSSKTVDIKLHKFSDAIQDTPLHRRYLTGTIAFIDSPYYTLSILEPYQKGGCEVKYFSATRSTVQETSANSKHSCKLAANAGFFSMTDGKCMGNIVSDGRVVQSANGIQNANFGIREDGTLVVGYIPEKDLYSTYNPFRQLVTGIVWLVRNGTNYVNESKVLECSENEDTGTMNTFVNVLSARTAIGHSKDGKLVMAQVEGQTHFRGANLYEFADLLIRRGVVNAINLDGGGSNTLVENGLVVNYPSDHCPYHGEYRCPRAVSTILCVHDAQCLEPNCSGHGSCVQGQCTCDFPWIGRLCDRVNCSLTNCSDHGVCSNGHCDCNPGWEGDFCDRTCPPDHYGAGCSGICWCYGRSFCDPFSGSCKCPPGLKGWSCSTECSSGMFGDGCKQECLYPDCSGHGKCSNINGTCLCNPGWTGVDCNETVVNHSVSSTLLSHLWPSLASQSNIETDPVISTYTSSCGSSLPSLSNQSNTTEESGFPWVLSIVILTALATVLLHLALCVGGRYCQRIRKMNSFNHTESLSLAGEWSAATDGHDDIFS